MILQDPTNLRIPGPTPVPPEVVEAMFQPVVPHRGTDFAELFRELLEQLKRIFHTEHEVFVIAGTGSTGWEASIVNTLSPGDAVLAAVSGNFGVRFVAALIALGLYGGGPGLTQRALARLIPYGYPGDRIVRYIEDDPARPMRAVGTGVDPNAFGGLMMVGFVLAIGQIASRNRIVPIPVGVAVAGATGAAMLLTYSRGAWVGAAVGVFVVLWYCARRWLIPLIGLGVVLVFLGVGAGFVERLWLGIRLEDPATRLRLQEYDNAWQIIKQHPWIGVGFGDAPSLDLQAGVSSIYLTVAEQAGLLGPLLFLTFILVVLLNSGLELYQHRDGRSDDLLVTLFATFAAILTVGLVDHYFFNIRFVHMVAVFWIVAGLLVALTTIRRQAGEMRRG